VVPLVRIVDERETGRQIARDLGGTRAPRGTGSAGAPGDRFERLTVAALPLTRLPLSAVGSGTGIA
jgi:hypothetical protein